MTNIKPLQVAIIWRRNGQKVKYDWLPGGWEGSNISGNQKRLMAHLQDIVTNKKLLAKQLDLPILNDENAPVSTHEDFSGRSKHVHFQHF